MGQPLGKRIKYNLIYHTARIVLFTIGALPRKMLISFFGQLGVLTFWIMKKERAKTLNNLKIAYGDEKSDGERFSIAKNTFKFLGRNSVDVFRYRKMATLQEYHKIVRSEGMEHLEKAYKEGKGVIAFTSHRGAFEMASTYLQAWGFQVTAVGAPLKDPRLNDLVKKNRSLYGVNYIERGESSLPLIKAFKSGHIVGMLIDQDSDKMKNVFVDFFGKKAATPVGAAALAARAGAPIVPVAIHMMPDKSHFIKVLPRVELVDTGDAEKDAITNTQTLSNIVEKWVREVPEQWVWMHERWKTRPPEEISK